MYYSPLAQPGRLRARHANGSRGKVARADFLAAALGVLTMQIGRHISRRAGCANAPNTHGANGLTVPILLLPHHHNEIRQN
jgi:hypothetical protein